MKYKISILLAYQERLRDLPYEALATLGWLIRK